MWGLITRRQADAELEAARGVYKGLVAEARQERNELRAEVETLATARDALARQVDEQNRRIVSLEADLRAKNNRITNMQKDIDRMEAEANANARFVEVGKARLAALEKAKRRAAA